MSAVTLESRQSDEVVVQLYVVPDWCDWVAKRLVDLAGFGSLLLKMNGIGWCEAAWGMYHRPGRSRFRLVSVTL